ncbi:MAG: hypothetical protein KDA21_13315, partial [Phycisphaerales bacterium]|nr:hypothetical protein [Phycisphaerales bacterium]
MPTASLARDRTVFATTSELPPDVDFVFAMDDAAAVRQGPDGARLEQVLATLLPLQPLSAELKLRWAALAAALDFNDPEVMFDEVFGERVVIASRVDNTRTQATVLITDISRAVENRIRRTLEPVPRRAHAGFNVLRPRGDQQFSMVLRRTETGAKLYMTLASHEELLDDVLELTQRANARTLADEP